ncbi:MAG: acyltransferase domain-containing protein, partial [Rubrivivax sp.]
LGVFAAGVVAGALSAEQALTLTFRQGQLFEQCCDAGVMIAVLASPTLYQQLPALHENAELAAVNFDNHFVVAMPLAVVDQVEAALKRSEAVFQRMAVSRAFHSRWIDPAQPAFKACIAALAVKPPSLPLVCCAPAGTLSVLDADTLWNTVRQPIQFQSTIMALERDGPWQYIDVGPSGTLATFVKYLLPAGARSTSQAMMTLFDRDVSHLQKLVPAFTPQTS